MSLKPSILEAGKRPFYSVFEQGIEFTPETPRGEWLDVMRRLSHMHDGAVMTQERCLRLMADALNWGEDKYGEDHAQAVDGAREALGLKPRTLANAMWAYKRIDPSRRKDGLRLGHYIVLAALDPSEQDRFITLALKDKMTVDTLKECVAEVHPNTKRGSKRKAAIDDEKTAIQKQVEVNDYLTGLDINDLGAAWKSQLEVPYKIYRRRFMKKARKK